MILPVLLICTGTVSDNMSGDLKPFYDYYTQSEREFEDFLRTRYSLYQMKGCEKSKIGKRYTSISISVYISKTASYKMRKMLVCPEHVKPIDIICSMKLSNQQAWLKIYCDHRAMAPHLCDSLRRHHDNRVVHT